MGKIILSIGLVVCIFSVSCCIHSNSPPAAAALALEDVIDTPSIESPQRWISHRENNMSLAVIRPPAIGALKREAKSVTKVTKKITDQGLVVAEAADDPPPVVDPFPNGPPGPSPVPSNGSAGGYGSAGSYGYGSTVRYRAWGGYPVAAGPVRRFGICRRICARLCGRAVAYSVPVAMDPGVTWSSGYGYGSTFVEPAFAAPVAVAPARAVGSGWVCDGQRCWRP